MNLIARASDILLAPGSAWQSIAVEEADTASLYKGYLMPLAAIPAVAGFAGMSLIGIGGFGVSYRVPVLSGLAQMLAGYVLTLAMVYAIALIADILAPVFGGRKDRQGAIKLIVYSSTAALIGGVFALFPPLAMLMLVTACYSLYLLFKGGPALMQIPEEKAPHYTGALIVCSLVLSLVAGSALGFVQSSTLGAAAMTEGGRVDFAKSPLPAGSSQLSIAVEAAGSTTTSTPGKEQFTIDSPKGVVSLDMGKMDAWNKRMEALGQKLESAQRSGDPIVMERTLKEMEALQREHPLAN